MAMFRTVFTGCVSDRSSRVDGYRSGKLKFGAPLSSALKNGYLPSPLMEILVYIAREGCTTVDLFRRPGNPKDTRRIVQRLTEGKTVIYSNYSFYTLASVVKKFLLRLPGGIFGPEGEEHLLQVLTIGHKSEQCQAVHEFIDSLSEPHQHLIALLFGTWFRMVNHAEINFMSVEALSRSCAGSVFHTCAADPGKVEKASRLMQILIDNFGVASMFGRDNIEFFTETTHTGIHIRERYRYQYQYPSEELLPHYSESSAMGQRSCLEDMEFIEMTRVEGDVHQEHEHDPSESPELGSPESGRHVSTSSKTGETSKLKITVTTASAPEVCLMPSPEVSKRPKSMENNLNETTTKSFYQSRSLSRFNSVKRKQLERLRQRSDWFLGPNYKDIKSSEDREQGSNAESGASVTRASSEGAVLEVFSDADSVFTDNTSRSESPASEPVRSFLASQVRRDIIHSDTVAEMTMSDIGQLTDMSRESHDITEEDMTETETRCFVVEHQYGNPGSTS
ncbi:uncharacterized protein LOC126809868 isoform X1 [Patella vulgata]|uniref:uncharacterized protein LOC126809868 isoform X1 n=1 Tax=Patella vulgata TaxID=6465 RepID=UPI00218073E3|nr:uncharacterized protein LOC126809868 isoform X1 [Patella vulgata]